VAGRISTAISLVAATALMAVQISGTPGICQWAAPKIGAHALYEDVSDQFKRGVDAYQQGDYEAAVFQLETARGMQPKSVWVRSYLAETYRKLLRFQ